MASELHLKYRPTTWELVLGHRSVVLSLKKALEKEHHRCFLFVGPSGVGKTTLARLVAAHVGASGDGILELNAASNTGIDDMRDLMERLSYATVDGGARCVILDELHMLSRQAFQSLLKILEEPPEGVFWSLCTTEGGKIPQNIQTRCATYVLKPVSEEIILKLLQDIKEKEKLRISLDGLEMISAAANGSPRLALVYLAKCGDFRNLASIKEVLSQPSLDDVEIRELCQMLLSLANGSAIKWGKIAAILRSLDVPAESARIIVLRYMNAVALSGGPKSRAALHVMSYFQEPFEDREGLAPLTLACASILYDEKVG